MVEPKIRLVVEFLKTPPIWSNASSSGSKVGISPDVVCSLHPQMRFKRGTVEDRSLGSNNR